MLGCEGLVKVLKGDNLPYEDLGIEEKTWDQIEKRKDNFNQFYVDLVLPALVDELKGVWKCCEEMSIGMKDRLEKSWIYEDEKKKIVKCNDII